MKHETNEELYDFRKVEPKWRSYWSEIYLYKTGDLLNRRNIYILDFFPYPSGDGLSVGHCRNYIPTCVISRFYRMNGFNVLHPMGWDAFGLPAENYAITHQVHPKESTSKFIANYKRQLKLIECSYDWSREINSTDPEYYRWTQWFFLLLFNRGLAYQKFGSQWWCPQCQTILANEQVEDGHCWRCHSEVTKKEIKQWYFKITQYADRLLTDLDLIDWPDAIKTMQRNWIGKSEGVEICFQVTDTDDIHENIRVFTTRVDTLFGVTFIALAPEHPLAMKLASNDKRAVLEAYIENSRRLSYIDRQTTEKEKTGVFTGTYAIHPITNEKIPVWVSNYVLMEYGTGAIMGVPGHDERDHAFACEQNLPIVEVVSPDGKTHGTDSCYSDYGIVINSGPYNGLLSEQVIKLLTDSITNNGTGQTKVQYKMRDWLISRQRYWGAPIPIVHCQKCGTVPVPESQLPVLLPDTTNFAPSGDGRSPLVRISDWVNTICPKCGGAAKRETDTMDGFACSSWYYLRFTNPHYETGPFDPLGVAAWMPVDIYVGGAEHAVMHLLYSRFWTKVMYDAGMVPFLEPFTQLRNQGMLLSEIDGQKMSKSRGNVVTPDEVVLQYGTDALRAYILFLGPFDAEAIWSDQRIIGVVRFLDRYWRLAKEITNLNYPSATSPLLENQEFEKARHKAIKQTTQNMKDFQFNVVVAALMEYLNKLYDFGIHAITPSQWVKALETFTILLCPIAPFITEEVWKELLGHTGSSVHQQEWPDYDEIQTIDEQLEIPVQVNGKLRAVVSVEANITDEQLKDFVFQHESLQRYLKDAVIRKTIIVPRRLINIVIEN